MLPSPASSLSFPSPLERREVIHMPAATGNGLRATSRTSRRRSVLNLSRPAHSSRRSAGVAIPRACFTPLGRGSGEPERVAEWLAALVHHFYLDGPVEPPRTTLGKERCETAPGLCRCCGQPFDFRHKRAALLLLGTHFAARAEAQAASVAATGAEECSPPSAAGAEMVTLSPWRSAVTLRQCTRASRIMKLTRVGETPSSWRCPSVARRAGGTSRRRSGCAWAAR